MHIACQEKGQCSSEAPDRNIYYFKELCLQRFKKIAITVTTMMNF